MSVFRKFRSLKRYAPLAVLVVLGLLLCWPTEPTESPSDIVLVIPAPTANNTQFTNQLYELIDATHNKIKTTGPYPYDIYAEHGQMPERPCLRPNPTLPREDEDGGPLDQDAAKKPCVIDRSKYHIRVDGPIGQPVSFGIVASNIAIELNRLGYKMSMNIWDSGKAILTPELIRVKRKQAWLWPPTTNALDIRISHVNSFQVHPSTHYFGLTASEIPMGPNTKLGPHLIKYIEAAIQAKDRVQKLFVPSHFVRELMAPSVNDALQWVNLFPHGFDERVFTFQPRLDRIDSSKFQFVWVSVWGGRKNTRTALEAFVRAFPDGLATLPSGEQIQVELKLVCGSPVTIHPWEREYWNSKPGIVIVEPSATRSPADIAHYYHEADCFVFPTLAEGFGLTVLEAMATGLPVIVPDYSGIRDFCDRQTCVMIPPTRMINLTLENDSGCGADIDPRVLEPVLQMVVLNRRASVVMGSLAANKAHRDWTWKRVVEDFDQRHICPLFAGTAS
ncbi:uncharacterized protein BJ171DRAFT_569809 [Polychytrium aggregatum]|uniref:uncharacterized protein n=1 Tax=Polychytrium aggregatum TaxID=110093 RepID=UPI0022FE2381|nr:uncharacterized protein BJ171DRAFT_569809 [Polychytrium aggregatum]KAI9202165.1 hypothetical protein BJ171DRAFT_569809 [Polychytrium aggregatum]